MTWLWGFLVALWVIILICGLIVLADVWTYRGLQRRLREERRRQEEEQT